MLEVVAQLGNNNSKKRSRPRPKSWQRGKGNAHLCWWYLPKNTSSCRQRGAEELRGNGRRVVSCSPTPAALGAAPPRWAVSPGHSPSGSSTQGRRGCGQMPCSPPSPACRGGLPRATARFRAGCRCLTCCRLGWRGRRAAVGAALGGQRCKGLVTPGKKSERGRDKKEILSGVFKSQGKGERAMGT